MRTLNGTRGHEGMGHVSRIHLCPDKPIFLEFEPLKFVQIFHQNLLELAKIQNWKIEVA